MEGERIAAMSSDEEEGEPAGGAAAMEEAEDDASVSSSSSSSAMSEAEAQAEHRPNEEEALALAEGAWQQLQQAQGAAGVGVVPYEGFNACAETLRGVAHSLLAGGGGGPTSPAAAQVVSRLREVRERFCQAHALPGDAWLEWVRDEATLTVDDGLEPSGTARALAVAERALQEDAPASVPLRLVQLALLEDRLQQQQGGEAAEEEEEGKVRKAFERAVTAAGTHVAEGHKIWGAYRAFEAQCLQQAIAAAASNPSPPAPTPLNLKEEKGAGGRKRRRARTRVEKAVDRVAQLYRRQAGLPLAEGCKTIEGEWQAFLASLPAMALPTTEGGAHLKAEYERTLSPVVGSLLQQARKMLEARLPLERALTAPGRKKHERVSVWEAYVALETAEEQLPRAQAVLERAVADCYFAPALWEDYLDLVQHQFHDPSQALRIAARAVKSAPASGALWTRYLLLLEIQQQQQQQQDQRPGQPLDSAAQKALEGPLQGKAEEGLAVLTAHVDAYRRRLLGAMEEERALDATLQTPAASSRFPPPQEEEGSESWPTVHTNTALKDYKAAAAYAERWLEALYPTWEGAKLALLRARAGALTDAALLCRHHQALSLRSDAAAVWSNDILGLPPPSTTTTSSSAATEEPTSTTAEGMELEGWKPSSTLAAYASTWAEATAWARGQGLVAEARKWARVGATASGVVKDSVEAAVEAWAETARELGPLSEYQAALAAAAPYRKARRAGQQQGQQHHPPSFSAAAATAASNHNGGNGNGNGNNKRGREEGAGRGVGGRGAGRGGGRGERGRGGRGRGGGRGQGPRAEEGAVEGQQSRAGKRARTEEGERDSKYGPSSSSAASSAPAPAAAAPTMVEEMEKEGVTLSKEQEEAYGRSVFVKRLPVQTTGAQLTAALEAALLPSSPPATPSSSSSTPSPVVEEVLLLTNRAGRPKGMAVVRLRTPELCQQALALPDNGRLPLGQEAAEVKPFNVKLAKAAEEQRRTLLQADAAATATGAAGAGEQQQQWHPTTVFITGLLHWNGGEKELRAVFEEGVPGCKVHAVNIALEKRTGKRKGSALLQFTDPAAVTPALQLPVGRLLGVEEAVRVRRSKFPAEAEPLPTTSTISSSSSSTSTDQPPQPVSTRPLTFFAPRALMRGKRALAAPVGRLAVAAVPTKGEGEGKEGEGKGKEQGNVKLSNDDFRKMMLGGGGK